MTFWYWYLFAAAALSFSGYVALDGPLTLAFAAGAHLADRTLAAKNRLVPGVIAAAAAAAGAALLWRGSFLPPVSTILRFLTDPSMRPSVRYVLEFTRQFLNPWMLAAGSALFALSFFGARKKPLILAVSAYLVFAAAWAREPKRSIVALDKGQEAIDEGDPPPSVSRPAQDYAALHLTPDPFYDGKQAGASAPPRKSPPPEEPVPEPGIASPKAFFREESGRVVAIPAPLKGAPPFDVIILHICSLSWKDIKDSGSDLLPFFSRFDYVFTNFSAACSYSGPAALRVLRAACGQPPHMHLYENVPAGCYLMDKLREAGFKTYTMATHDGKYDHFTANSRKFGHADAPLGIKGLPTAYQLFDGAPMAADDAALGRFWKARLESNAPRAAVYFNTANLHMGTRKPGVARGLDDIASYKERLGLMAAQLEGFFSEVEKSGRNAVVIFVPEHGAALTGTKMQAKDVRDIPLPPIATVPVAVKLIGKTYFGGADTPQVITKSASFLALAWLIAEFLRHNPYSVEARKPEAVAKEIPGTEFFAEDENASVMRMAAGFVYKLKGRDWTPLPDYALIPPGTIPSPQEFKRGAR